MTAQAARDAILAGRTVRMTVGTDPDDPVLDIYLEGREVYCTAIAGWSAGVTEAVCERDSDFLLRYLTGDDIGQRPRGLEGRGVVERA